MSDDCGDPYGVPELPAKLQAPSTPAAPYRPSPRAAPSPRPPPLAAPRHSLAAPRRPRSSRGLRQVMGRASLAALAGGAEVDEAGGMEKGLLKVAIDR